MVSKPSMAGKKKIGLTQERKKEEKGQGDWNVGLRRGKRRRCERIRGKVEPRFLRRTKTGFRIGLNQLNTGLGESRLSATTGRGKDQELWYD